jgi:hypothetical protein
MAMTVGYPKMTQEEIDNLFVRVDPPELNTFEFALVLGGTVSAGAYTAGAVDFLIEALDCWNEARNTEGDTSAPRHRVLLKVITGTSGGGVNAAIAARALAYRFPHVARAPAQPEPGTGNPFYDTWASHLTLSGLLDTSDIAEGSFVSLLNGKPLDDNAAFIAGFAAGNTVARPYLGDPLRIILTATNLRGVPYKTVFADNSLCETFVDHADHVRFAVVYPGHSLSHPRPDELVLGFGDPGLEPTIDWHNDFSLFARGTCAFPIGFPPRPLVRPMQHYRYRVMVIPPGDKGEPARVVARQPDWAGLIPPDSTDLPADYRFLAVDGGATDNEPIELGRTALAGVLGRNPRDAKTATRAVVLIDPFAGKTDLGPTGPSALPDVVGAILSTFIEQTRYDSADLLLAVDPNVFSRFMITPERDGRIGGDAIASNGLGAFIGFACPAFMRHDYFLGRANCQKFLRTTFVLDEANPVFQGEGVWTSEQKRDLGMSVGGERYLPIIPLLGTASVTQSPDPWPRHQLDPEIYKDAIEKRFKAIVEFEGGSRIVSAVISLLVAHVGEDKVADFIINAMHKYLKNVGLS